MTPASKNRLAKTATWPRTAVPGVLPLLVALCVGASPLFFAPAFAADGFAQSRAASSGAAATRDVKDDLGRVVRVPQPVKRIVSLAPSITETLFALGLGDRIAGDTIYCDYPAEARNKPHIGGPVNPNLEQIAALHPDLVIATRSINRQATVNSLEHLGIAVYVTDARTVEEVLTSTERLASIAQAGEQGARTIGDFRRRLASLHAALSGVKPAKVFVVVWQEPLISVGSNTFVADALRWAGANSILMTSQDWPNVSLEAVVHLQPEYLIFSSDDRTLVQHQIEQLRTQSGWRQLQAVRENKIIVLGEAISHPSTRLIDAVEALARALYPRRFAAFGLRERDARSLRALATTSRDTPSCAAPRCAATHGAPALGRNASAA